MGPDNDRDRAAWLSPDMPTCVDCDTPTALETPEGISLCPSCAEKRDEEAWMRQQARAVAAGSTPRDLMDRAYETDRRLR